MAELAVNQGIVKAGDLIPCPYCGSPIVAGEGTTVTCDVCRKVSAKASARPWLTEEVRPWVYVEVRYRRPRPAPEPYELRVPGEVSQPRSVALERDGRTLTLRFRAVQRGDFAWALAASVFLAFLGVWVEGMVRGVSSYAERPWSGAILLGFLTLAISRPLGRFLAPVVLTASPGLLEVKSGLFGARKQRFERARLRQLYCLSRHMLPDEAAAALERFHLIALLDDQTTVELAELSDPETALYLERELERSLDIQDKPVNRTT